MLVSSKIDGDMQRIQSSAKPSTPTVSGQGIVDEGPEFFWSRPSWSTIEDEEFVFYSPILGSSGPKNIRAARLGQVLCRALGSHLYWTVETLGGHRPGSSASQALLAEINAAALLGRLDVNEIYRGGALEAKSWYGRASIRHQASAASGPFWRFFGRRNEGQPQIDQKKHCFHMIALLARCLDTIDCDERSDWSISDLVLIALHSGVNPAYLAPSFGYLGESLAVACWVGILMRGHSALLPPSIAETGLEILKDQRDSAEETRNAVIDVMIRHQINLVLGLDRFRRVATQSAAYRCVIRVDPRH